MKILFYRYGSIVEQHMLDCFISSGLEVIEDTRHITDGNVSSSQIVSDVSRWLSTDSFLFVFSINFFPEVSDVCNIYNIIYVSWTVDCPFIQLFSPSLKNKCNKIFFFDRAQYERFGKELGSSNGFYLPLAGNPVHFGTYINECSKANALRFTSDISFVGSLYNEKNPLLNLSGISDELSKKIRIIEEEQMSIYGDYIIESRLTDDIITEFSGIIPGMDNNNVSTEFKKYQIAHFIIGYDLAFRERVSILNAIAQEHSVDLYSLSDASALKNVSLRGSANTFTEMPIIFNKSKINLNITMRPIITGLSQRIYDVLACGGFLITNYQEELPELFEIGKDLECFSSTEELLDKINYYLIHDTEREAIAAKGLEKIKKKHTFEHRFRDMLAKILKDAE